MWYVFLLVLRVLTVHELQGLVMASTLEKASRFLRPFPGVSCKFDPFFETVQPGNSTSIQLREFVLLAESPEIPQPHLLSADGNFHSGDLFEPQPDGTYISRGRDDDWIKSADTDRCDTKLISFVLTNMYTSP